MRGGHQTVQIINYDAGIVLIDLHQLNVKTTSDNTNQRHWIRGNLMSTKNRTRRTTTHSIRFPNQMIEQINIALEQKGSRNFSAWVIEACRRRLTSEERIHQLKVMKNEHPRVLPSEQDDIVNSLNYEGIAVIELQFYHFHNPVTDCVLAHVTD